ncbi:MAG TPA: hypothetical protein VF395_00075, partial [Polyangiaceae bacterium]
MRSLFRFGSPAFPSLAAGREHPSKRLVPWLSVSAIWLVFDLPMALAPDRLDLGFVRPTGEILALFTALGLSHRVRHGRPIRWVPSFLHSPSCFRSYESPRTERRWSSMRRERGRQFKQLMGPTCLAHRA